MIGRTNAGKGADNPIIVKNVFDVWVGSVNGQYYNFCKYITMESFKEISTKLGLKDLSQLYP